MILGHFRHQKFIDRIIEHNSLHPNQLFPMITIKKSFDNQNLFYLDDEEWDVEDNI